MTTDLEDMQSKYLSFKKTLSPTFAVELAGQIPHLFKEIEKLHTVIGKIISTCYGHPGLEEIIEEYKSVRGRFES